jgi:glycosyltransferase involved in cell wall biosynthesis
MPPFMLFVAPTLPFPANTGFKIRLANLLKAACAQGPVKFIGYVDMDPRNAGDTEAGIRELRETCPDMVLIPQGEEGQWPAFEHDSLRWALRHYLGRRGAFIYREYACDTLLREVRKHAPAADVIWVARLYIAHRLREFGSRIVVDLDDLESVKIARRMKGWKLSLPVLAARYDQWKTRRTEQAALGAFGRLVVCSEHDALAWRGGRDKVWIVPNGFDEALLSLPLPPAGPPRVIFTGALFYWPNTEAALFFVRKVMPQLLARQPTLEFWIVGRSPPAEVRALDDGKTIRVFADVAEVPPYLRQAAVSVVPLRVGGGTRLKILESLAAGVPVVTTSVGVEGIALEPDRHFLLANTPDEFVAQILRLLENPSLGHRQVLEAREAIAQRYTWRSIRDALSAQLRDFRLRSASATGTIHDSEPPGAFP